MAFGATASAQDSPPQLRINPFTRPAYTLTLDAVARPVAQQVPIALELRATMVGPDSAYANINGRILSAGQGLEGYRVLWINEGRAMLVKDGERLLLNVYERQLGLDREQEGRPELSR